MARFALACFASGWLAAGCGGAPPDGRDAPAPGAVASSSAPNPVRVDPMTLYRARDYFGLRDRLGAPAADDEEGAIRRTFGASPEGRADTAAALDAFLRAAVAHAFNRPERSNALLARILHDGTPLPDSLAAKARELRIANHLRLHRYGEALASARAVLSDPGAAAPGDLEEVRNTIRMLEALADVPPQETRRNGTTVLRLEAGRVPVRFGEATRRYAFDTGANLSVLMRSEAESLGLDVRPAGVTVGTSTDLKLEADIAVAPRLRIGGIGYRNVVFLVFPDRALTFPGGFRIPGLLGFPVIEAMGELRFRGDSVEVPGVTPPRPPGTLALDGLDPLLRVGFRGDSLLCRLDTGANRTAFYGPFYRRYEALVEERGRPRTATTGGVGGIRRIPIFELEAVEVEVAGATAELREVQVYTRPLFGNEKDEHLFCNIGLDLLDLFDERILNFRSMSLVLR